jgi:hypothetical protein
MDFILKFQWVIHILPNSMILAIKLLPPIIVRNKMVKFFRFGFQMEK